MKQRRAGGRLTYHVRAVRTSRELRARTAHAPQHTKLKLPSMHVRAQRPIHTAVPTNKVTKPPKSVAAPHAYRTHGPTLTVPLRKPKVLGMHAAHKAPPVRVAHLSKKKAL